LDIFSGRQLTTSQTYGSTLYLMKEDSSDLSGLCREQLLFARISERCYLLGYPTDQCDHTEPKINFKKRSPGVSAEGSADYWWADYWWLRWLRCWGELPLA